MIDHRRTGWLAPPFETESLAAGIAWVLEDAPRRTGLCAAARETAETPLSEAVVAGKYVALYARVLGEKRAAAL